MFQIAKTMVVKNITGHLLDLESSILLTQQVLDAKTYFDVWSSYMSKKGSPPTKCQTLLISFYYQPHYMDKEIEDQEDKEIFIQKFIDLRYELRSSLLAHVLFAIPCHTKEHYWELLLLFISRKKLFLYDAKCHCINLLQICYFFHISMNALHSFVTSFLYECGCVSL